MSGDVQLQELLFGLQNPTNEKIFIDRCVKLFETEDSKTWIDVYQPEVTQATLVGAVAANKSPSGSATSHQVGDDINYLGRCGIPCYRETSIRDFKLRLELLSGDPAASAASTGPKRPIFYIVRQRHSWSRLLTSRELLDCALSIFDPRVNDFILPFGAKWAETDIGGPRLWFHPSRLGSTEHDLQNNKYYDCAYTLKYVEPTRRDIPDKPWSERQTTIATHHGEGSSWVLVSPSVAMQEFLDRYMRALRDDERENTFAIHLLFIEAAMINWQPYLAYLTKETQEEANRAIVTSWEGGKKDIKTLHFEDSQKLQTIQNSTTDMCAMLDSTIDIITSLEEKYYIFHLGLDAVSKSRVRCDPVAFALHEKTQELKYMRQKLETLNRGIEATVKFASSLLGLENGQSLRALAEEARKEGKAMHGLTEKATQDAAAVKVITVITMIYLPLTVVASFFSTIFVARTSDGPTTTVQVADNWWVLAAVGFPLTAITFFMWWAISQRLFLLDALRKLRARSMEQLRALASTRGSKKSVSDQESLPRLEVASPFLDDSQYLIINRT